MALKQRFSVRCDGRFNFMMAKNNDIGIIEARLSYEAAMMYFNHIDRSIVLGYLDDLMQQGVWADS
ncbi:hypothetical protein [Maritalea myrionectae]|uniref:hypothetical protein n=1 Tax=Maritalea myrionectae TaxID=454601 RepID=UPI001469ECBA|nr:hypothetical protein [Maritalea myrionectae]